MSRAEQRIRVVGELSRVRTLDAGPSSFTRLGDGCDVLLLGLGPHPAALAPRVEGARKVRYVEATMFERQMPAGWRDQIPAAWRRIAPESVTERVAAESRIYCYNPNRQLFPSFWGSLWAFCQHVKLAHCLSRSGDGPVWIPAAGDEPLVPELTVEFRRSGIPVRILPAAGLVKSLRRLLRREVPRCAVSINFSGLDPYGEVYALLRQAGVPVAVWCVDNPFHLLTRMRAAFWRELHLFVTDDWFVAPLRRIGAVRPHPLPLAASPAVFGQRIWAEGQRLDGRIVFVGRSRFKGKKRFFAGCRIPEAVRTRSRALMNRGRRPDFAWWWETLGRCRLWPGHDVRQTGFGAEEASQRWRVSCLSFLAVAGRLTVFGDRSWRELLPAETDVRPPVDYYRELPQIYGAAPYTLNLTSLLLPRGLTQRHFDVWAAGGFLVSDRTPGLALFPRELTEEIAFQRPEQVAAIIDRFDADPKAKQQLAQSWRKLILARHTYQNRIDEILHRVGAVRTHSRKTRVSEGFGPDRPRMETAIPTEAEHGDEFDDRRKAAVFSGRDRQPGIPASACQEMQ